MLTRILREPILHFLLTGAVIFAVFFALEEPVSESDAADIVVTPQLVERLAAQFDASWRRSPSVVELDALIDSYVHEEILVREALALSLDQGDTVIRQRLRQNRCAS